MNLFVAIFLATGISFFGGQIFNPFPAEIADQPAETPPVVSPAPVARPVVQKHVVVPGENLTLIAESYGVELEALQAANPGVGETIYPGDEIFILSQRGTLYTVNNRDTLSEIAQVYDVPVDTLLAANGKQDDRLAVGEKIFVPGDHPANQVSRGSYLRLVWPVQGPITSPFGVRWGRLHAGIDIAADTGEAVRAAKAGCVEFAGWRSGYGYTVMLEHGQNYGTLYGHLSDYFVTGGQYVAMGQIIGQVGTTGNSTGPHLHFEITREGQALNPLVFLP